MDKCLKKIRERKEGRNQERKYENGKGTEIEAGTGKEIEKGCRAKCRIVMFSVGKASESRTRLKSDLGKDNEIVTGNE